MSDLRFQITRNGTYWYTGDPYTDTFVLCQTHLDQLREDARNKVHLTVALLDDDCPCERCDAERRYG